MTELFANPFACRDKSVNIDARFDSHAVKHVDQIFRRNVTGRTWGKRTSADTTGRRIYRFNAVLD